MVVGDDEKRLEHIKFLVNQARDGSKECYHPEIGFNYRMTSIEAALGLAQLERLDGFLEKKRRFNAIYKDELKEIKSIRFQKEYAGAESLWWISSIIFEERIEITALQKRLKEEGIPTRRVFMPVVEFPPYKGNDRKNFKNSYDIHERGLSLPSSTLNSDDDIRFVCRKIKELISR